MLIKDSSPYDPIINLPTPTSIQIMLVYHFIKIETPLESSNNLPLFLQKDQTCFIGIKMLIMLVILHTEADQNKAINL